MAELHTLTVNDETFEIVDKKCRDIAANAATIKYVDDGLSTKPTKDEVFTSLNAWNGDFDEAPLGTWWTQPVRTDLEVPCSNYPTGATFGFLTTMIAGGDYYQIYQNYDTQAIYTRNNVNEWKDWKQLAQQDYVNSLNTTMTSVVGKKVEMVVAYTRTSTTSSLTPDETTGAATISTPLLADCTYVAIIPYWDINNARNLPIWFAKIGHTGYMNGINPADNTIVARTVTATSTSSISFGSGYKNGATNNQVCIPRYIIGFKGVS